jgi:tryptophan synthase alpha chain
LRDLLSRSLKETFSALRTKGEKALVLFITAGDPSMDDLPRIMDALQQGGADVIELGIPFSDPIADGPVIQASTQRALEGGATPLSALKALSACDLQVPVVLMGYYNPIHRRGFDAFAMLASDAGAAGTIVTDLTPEEADEWIAASKAHNLNNIFLAAPTSTDARLDEVCRRSTGFVYAVSRTGVTGTAQSVPAEVADLVAKLKERTLEPVCVGFGITKPEHVATVCKVADGAVIGTWLVDVLHRTWNGGNGRAELVRQVKELKAATR